MKRSIPLLAAAVLAVAASTITSTAIAQVDVNEEDLVPRMVVKIYDITGILTGTLPDYPARKNSDIDGEDAIFPNPESANSYQPNYQSPNEGFENMQSGPVYGQQGIFCQGPPRKHQHPMAINMDDLTDLITTTVEPENWDTVGGPSSLGILGNLLIASCSEAMHEKIANLLDMLKKNIDQRKNITVEVDFVELPRDQIELLLADENDESEPAVFGLVQPEEWQRIEPVYNSILTGSNRQTVSTVSGNQHKAVVSAIPVVGDFVEDAPDDSQDESRESTELQPSIILPQSPPTSIPIDETSPQAPAPTITYDSPVQSRSNRSVGYQPVITVIQTGIAIEVAPILSQDGSTVLLDIRARQVEESTDAPETTAREPIHPSYPGPLDRPKLTNWHLATTLRVPVGRRVLVGGMDSLYLFVMVTAR